MGNMRMPFSLPQLAKLCDCLENTQKFKHQPDPTQKSEKSQVEQKHQQTPKRPQPRRLAYQKYDQILLQQPAQVKLNKTSSQQRAMKRRSNLRIKQNQNDNSKQKIDQISDISIEPQPHNRTDDLQIFRIDKDKQVKENELRKFYNPLFRTAKDFKPQRPDTLLKTSLKDEQLDIEISEINQGPSNDYQHQFFLNKQDKDQYIDKNQKKLISQAS